MVDGTTYGKHGFFHTHLRDQPHRIYELGYLQQAIIAEVIRQSHLHLVGSTNELQHAFHAIASETHLTTLVGQISELLNRRASINLSHALRQTVHFISR